VVVAVRLPLDFFFAPYLACSYERLRNLADPFIAENTPRNPMPAISTRAEQMPASPIRKLVPYADRAKAEGVKVYHLNIGQPDLATPPVFYEAINKAAPKVIEYSNSAGNESLRRKMAEFYNKFGIVGLTHQDVMVTTGGSEAIIFAMLATLNEGDEVLVPEPFYANYNGFAMEAGVIVKPLTTRIEDGFALPSAEAFEAQIGARTRAILICNPSNPTGKLYPREELEHLMRIVKQHDLFLFADEVYKEFCYDGETFVSALTFDDVKQNVIMVDSVSKRYSACGVRIGCLISRNKEVMQGVLKFAQARLSPPTLGQIGTEAMLDLPQSYYDGIIAQYVIRRDLVWQRLSTLPGVICPKPAGAFYLMARLPIDDSDAFCQWLLEHFRHKGATVMLAPGTGFYSTPGLGKQEVRLAYVLNEADLTLALDCLEAALVEYTKLKAVQA
jgi:aspartate aminotransferase